MILSRKFLLLLLLCWPVASFADDAENVAVEELAKEISEQTTVDNAVTSYKNAFEKITAEFKDLIDQGIISSEKGKVEEKIKDVTTCPEQDKENTEEDKKEEEKPAEQKYNPTKTDTRTDEQKQADLAEKTQAFEDAKAKEQSKENRTLTALTTAATGIGGMELAMGLSEQKADKEADMDMAAYLATMRCTYGNDVQVKAGPDEIELPGASDAELMALRDEYFALAKDLKERKEALGMKPGIESEEIIDKAQTGLYDDESLSIDSGAYASLYRAQMLGSEVDQQKIDEERKASKNRVIAGGVVAGAGVVGGIVGNAVINKEKDSKLKDLDKEKLEEKVEEIKTEIKQRKPEAAAAAASTAVTAATTTNIQKCDDADNCLRTDGYNYRALNGDFGTKIPHRSCHVPSEPKSKDYTDPKGEIHVGLSKKADLSTCSGLEPNEWEINFSYGTVRGTSMCSSTPGTHVGKLQGYDVTPVPGNPTPGTNRENGKYCWCRATNVPYSNYSTNVWIPMDTEGHTCYEFGCAHSCVIMIQSLDTYRKSLFGFYDYVEDTQ